jgi:hypothetical protein
VARADEYRDLNIQARLVAALMTVESWLGVYVLTDAAVEDLLEHMWQWPAVTPEAFLAWYDFDSEWLRAAERANPLPSPTVSACQERGAPAEDLAVMLAGAVKIVYDSLFAALDPTLSLSRLRDIEVAAARSGVAFPSPQRFSRFKAQDKLGWGYPVPAAQIAS